MSNLVRARALYHRDRLSRCRKDDADPTRPGARARATIGGDRERVRRRRHRRRNPQGMRRRGVPGRKHCRTRQRLSLLHRGGRLRTRAWISSCARRPAVEHIVIETSGLALPKPLVQAFHWPAIKSRVTVDGVVAVVDGPALAAGRVAADLDALARQRQADTALDHDDPIEEVFDDQIACADLVVLNKRDLMDSAGADKAMAAIAKALPRAVKIVPVADGKVDPAALLGLGMATEDDIANRRTRHDAELEHDHDDFDSFVLPLPEISDPASLAARIAAAAAGCQRAARQGLRRGDGQTDAPAGSGRRAARHPPLRSRLDCRRGTQRPACRHRPEGT